MSRGPAILICASHHPLVSLHATEPRFAVRTAACTQQSILVGTDQGTDPHVNETRPRGCPRLAGFRSMGSLDDDGLLGGLRWVETAIKLDAASSMGRGATRMKYNLSSVKDV